MAKFDKLAVLNKMAATPLVPVFFNSDAETIKKVVKACYDGGVRCFEFTNRGDFAQDVFASVVKFAKEECPELAMGVGSIVDAPTAALFIQLGACFVVGPLFNLEVAKLANRRQILYIPGCGSVSEIGIAQEAGCEIVKVFPGDVLGPKFVKGLLAPMPWTKAMVTGGVEPTRENISGWFNAGTFCIGMGSKLFPKDRIEAADWNYITDITKQSIEYIK